MTDIAISVSNVSKCYRVFDNQRSRLLHAVWPKYQKGMQEVWALKDINFEIKRGEAVAIIGRNGGGKSTLLEILTGTLTPSAGEVKVNGRVSALLELGSGFNPEYSGRDNVILNGLLLGLSRDEILSRFNEIEAFAEIGAAIDRPVKTYSSGMMMRLAFAVQVLCDPDILIIDEALSVGDFFFQQKCLSYIRGLCTKGVTLLFVSHDMGTVRDICRRAIYLRTGHVSQDGKTSEVISKYLGDAHTDTVQSSTVTLKAESEAFVAPVNTSIYKSLLKNALWSNESQALNKNGKVLAIAICDANGNPCNTFKVGDRAVISIAYASDLTSECHAGVSILNKFGQVMTVVGSYFSQTPLPKNPGLTNHLQITICELAVTLQLEVGQYSLEVSTGVTTAPNRGAILDRVPSLGPLSISWDHENDAATFLGQVGLPVECRCFLTEGENISFNTNNSRLMV